MSDLPKLAIAMVTYKRTEVALRTIHSTFNNLNYPKENIGFYLADDGSPKEHHEQLIEAVESHGIKIIGEHNDRFRYPGQEDTHNAGIGWNKALGISHQFSDFVLFLEDDWELENPLELIPYVKLLQEREDVGICSFRILSVEADVRTVGHDGKLYLQYARTTQYSYSGNPNLRHARYTRHYGWFIENGNPGEIELKMDDQYLASINGPHIWRPLDISIWGGWFHIGQEKSWE